MRASLPLSVEGGVGPRARLVGTMVVAPLAWILALAAFSALLRVVWLRQLDAPIAAGAIVMAAGIFELAALQHLPGPVTAVTLALGLEIAVVWVALALAYAAAEWRGLLQPRLHQPLQRIALGTWVAGTAVLAEVLHLAVPRWTALALGAGLLSVLLWLWLLGMLATTGPALVAALKDKATGLILLTTVATQAIVLAMHAVAGKPLPSGLDAMLIALGALFYVAGLCFLAHRYLLNGWCLADDWQNPNCIIHGAMSITGLAVATTGVFPIEWAIVVWLWVVTMFALVEGVEVARAVARVRRYGWRRGLFTYDVSQWARNFTFGMFYAFSAALLARLGGTESTWLRGALADVTDWGQYIVLAFLLVEVGLFFDAGANGAA